MIIRRAPAAMRARKASGKARSQQMRRPMGPRGVRIGVCGVWVEEVRWGRSGCLGAPGVVSGEGGGGSLARLP